MTTYGSEDERDEEETCPNCGEPLDQCVCDDDDNEDENECGVE